MAKNKFDKSEEEISNQFSKLRSFFAQCVLLAREVFDWMFKFTALLLLGFVFLHEYEITFAYPILRRIFLLFSAILMIAAVSDIFWVLSWIGEHLKNKQISKIKGERKEDVRDTKHKPRRRSR